MRHRALADRLYAAAFSSQAPFSCSIARQAETVIVLPLFGRRQHWAEDGRYQLIRQVSKARQLIGQHILLQHQLRSVIDMLPLTSPTASGTEMRTPRRDAVAGSCVESQASSEQHRPALAGYLGCYCLSGQCIGHEYRFAIISAQSAAALRHVADVELNLSTPQCDSLAVSPVFRCFSAFCHLSVTGRFALGLYSCVLLHKNKIPQGSGTSTSSFGVVVIRFRQCGSQCRLSQVRAESSAQRCCMAAPRSRFFR